MINKNESDENDIPVMQIGRTDRMTRIAIKRDIAGMFVVLFALCVTAIVIIDKNATEDELRDQLSDFRSEERTIAKIDEDKLECRRRYQVIVDQNDKEQLNILSDYIVILTLTEDPDKLRREAQAKALELQAITLQARADERAKIEYDNLENPLPCPLGEIVAPPIDEERG